MKNLKFYNLKTINPEELNIDKNKKFVEFHAFLDTNENSVGSIVRVVDGTDIKRIVDLVKKTATIRKDDNDIIVIMENGYEIVFVPTDYLIKFISEV